MSRQTPPMGDIGDALTDCVGKCRHAQCKEDLHKRRFRRPWNQALLDWFREQCKEEPDLAWIASMIHAEGRSGLANELLPGIERYLGRYVFDEFAIPVPPQPQRPELVVDNAGRTGEAAPAAKRGGRKPGGVSHPSGDAA